MKSEENGLKSTIFLAGAEGGIWTLAPFFRQSTPLAGEPLRPLGYFRRSIWSWRREWDSNPRRLAPRRFSRPVPSTARTSLRIVLHFRTPKHDTISRGNLSTKNPRKAGKVFLKKLKKRLANGTEACYIKWAGLREPVSGCGAVGSALDWGSRGREFKSRHSDHRWVLIGLAYFLFSRLVVNIQLYYPCEIF